MLDIIDFVNTEIKASGYHNRLPAGIIITGGGSKLAGIETLFRERTGYDVRLGSAESDISVESIDGFSAPELTTAIGLLNIGLAEMGTPATEYSKPNAAQTHNEEQQTIVVEKPEEQKVVRITTPDNNPDNGPHDTPDNDGKVEKKEKTDKKRGKKEREEQEQQTPRRGFLDKVKDFFFGTDVTDDELM